MSSFEKDELIVLNRIAKSLEKIADKEEGIVTGQDSEEWTAEQATDSYCFGFVHGMLIRLNEVIGTGDLYVKSQMLRTLATDVEKEYARLDKKLKENRAKSDSERSAEKDKESREG